MKIEHDIFWGQKHIGCCKISLSYHGISFHEIKTKYDIDSNLLTRWFYSRCVPSSRINYKAIIKIMAVPEYTNRWYDFICTACVLNYGRSLTDPFWLNPRQKYIYRYISAEPLQNGTQGDLSAVKRRIYMKQTNTHIYINEIIIFIS